MLRFWAYRARPEGKPLPRWQRHAIQWVEGIFSLREEHDEWLGRTVRVARLKSDRRADIYPPLIEAQLTEAGDDRMVFSGIEGDELTKCDRAQTWVLRASTPSARRTPRAPKTPRRALSRWKAPAGATEPLAPFPEHQKRGPAHAEVG